MDITKIIEYLVAWGLLVLAQSVFINGVYQSATGETKKRVDGTDEDSEMILYPLKKFLTNTYKVNRQYMYSSKDHLLDKIKRIFPDVTIKKNTVYGISDLSEDEINIWRLYEDQIQDKLSVRVEFGQYGITGFFLQEDEYWISKWLRKPIIQCIKCMSSFWGALTYWPVVLFLFGFHWLEIPIFFADMFSLTYINWILYKKAQ